MTASRRTMIFIDGSAFRDTLRKAHNDKFRRLEEAIANHAVDRQPCRRIELNFRADGLAASDPP